jgi:hypothetical protein
MIGLYTTVFADALGLTFPAGAIFFGRFYLADHKGEVSFSGSRSHLPTGSQFRHLVYQIESPGLKFQLLPGFANAIPYHHCVNHIGKRRQCYQTVKQFITLLLLLHLP